MGYAAFAGIIAVLAVVIAVQLFPGAVGGSGDGGLSCTSLDLCFMEMIEGYTPSPPEIISMTAGREKILSARA